jgi:hypothetical protein
MPFVTFAQYRASFVVPGMRACKQTWRNWNRGVCQEGRGRGGETPVALLLVEDVRHRYGNRIIDAEWLKAENFFDGTHEIDGLVSGGNHLPLLHVWPGDESNASMRLNVIGAVLRVVFSSRVASRRPSLRPLIIATLAYVPAARENRIDPLVALRQQ